MSTTRNLVRAFAASAIGIAMTVPFAAAPAQADPIIDMSWTVGGSTTVKKLNKTIVLPAGTLDAKIDLATSKLTGDLHIPRINTKLDIGSLPLADIAIELHQAAPLTGTFDFPTAYANTKATFNVQIVSIRPVFLPFINLVSGKCTTKTPATASMAGTVALGGLTTFKTTFTLPEFKDCGLLTTPVINLAMSGAGNGMEISLQ